MTDFQHFLAPSRRGFMGIAGAGVATLALPIGMTRAETPKRGGHLAIGLDGASSTQTLDPGTFSQSFDQNVGMQLFNTLVEQGMTSVEPALAESWESDDLTTWVFKIRKGVQFHNGKELKAADVIYSLNHHRGDDSTSSAKPLMAAVQEIKSDDPYTVTIVLAAPDVDFPYIMAAVQMCIVPEDSNFADGIGTGAFVLKEFDPGVRVLTERNPNYWRSDRGFVDTVETLGINDVSARINALISGQVQMINRPDPKLAKRLEGTNGINLYNTPGRGFNALSMLTDLAPFDNNDLRLAIKYSMDRDAVIQKIASGYGTVANDHPVPSSDPMFAPDIPQRAYDPDKAAFHFKKSGVTGEIPITAADVFSGATDAILLLQSGAAAAGIDLTVNRVPVDGYMDNVFGKAGCSPNYWNGRPTANMIMTLAYYSKAPWNAGHFQDAQFDELLIAGRSEKDETKRKQIYHDLQFILNERGSDLAFMFFNILDATSSKVKGYVPMPQAEMSGLRAAEKVWLED
jgi:peptide/nickel transport system substrate-binding protein